LFFVLWNKVQRITKTTTKYSENIAKLVEERVQIVCCFVFVYSLFFVPKNNRMQTMTSYCPQGLCLMSLSVKQKQSNIQLTSYVYSRNGCRY